MRHPAMNPQEADRRASHTAKVIALFKAYPMRWINATAFMEIGGAMAWRTRISDARKALPGTVENRTKRCDGIVISEYRWLPYDPLGPDAATDRTGQRDLPLGAA